MSYSLVSLSSLLESLDVANVNPIITPTATPLTAPEAASILGKLPHPLDATREFLPTTDAKGPPPMPQATLRASQDELTVKPGARNPAKAKGARPKAE